MANPNGLKEYKSSYTAKLGLLGLLILWATMLYFRWQYSSPFARSWDEVDFALALDRFDLLAMQPHFPGYPYFILGGMLFRLWIEDPVQALSSFNVFMTALSAIPIYLLARRKLNPLWSGTLTLLVQSLPYYGVITTQPMSEGTAIAILWWYLWSIQVALERRSFVWGIVPLFWFGLLMGVRLSFIPFSAGLLWLWYADWKRNRSHFGKRLAANLVIAVFFQLVWISGLVFSEGGIVGFIELSKGFIEGHFSSWGGAVTASSLPVGERIVQFFLINLFWIALSGRSIIMAISIGVLSILLLKSVKTITWKWDSYYAWMGLCILAYLLWAFIAQNVEKPRHVSPLIGPIVFLSYYVLLQSFQVRTTVHRLRRTMLMMGIFLFMGFQMVYGTSLAHKQATELPSIYQLTDEVSTYSDNLVVYTWEETRVMHYLNAPFSHKRIQTFEYFIEELSAREDQRIFLTNKVLDGFEMQAGDLRQKVHPVATFHSDPLFDPVYHDIVLYEWVDFQESK
jgi:hypothetical protein